MSVQIIKKDGKPDYAIMPYDEFQSLIGQLEDKQDREAISAYQSGEETFPASVVDAILDGENPIRVYRKHRAVTQADLANAIGKSKIYIAKLEAGDRTGTVEVLAAIADVLEVDIDQLI